MKKLSRLSCVGILAVSLLPFLKSVPLNAQTNFVKYVGNPILPLGENGEWDDTEASHAHVSFDGTTYQMWYSGAPVENTYRIGYATSADGIDWVKDATNPVLSVGAPGTFDSINLWLPAVLFNGSSYEMWYSGGLTSSGIGYATSPDPVSWVRESSDPVLDKSSVGAWDDRNAFLPIVLRTDTLYQMWYTGRSAAGIWQTGYATSTDGMNWSKHPDNPVLTVGASGAWDANAAAAGSVLFADGEYHMWYHGEMDSDLTGIAIGYATSTDGINWTKYPDNPILQPGLADWDAKNVWFPSVIKDGHRYRMWYTGTRPGTTLDRLGYAEDFSDAAHVDSVWVSHKFVLAGSETIAIYGIIANPHSESLTARALVESDDGLINEAVELSYYAGPVENLWMGFWNIPAEAHHYSVSVDLTNHTASYIHKSSDWGVIQDFQSHLPTHNFTQTANINDGGEARGVAIAADGTVFLANWNDGLRAYRYDGTSFTLMASIDDGGTASDVALSSEGTVFLANSTDGLRAYHYDGTSFTNTAHIDDGGEAVAVTVAADGTVFLANWYNGLFAYRYTGTSFMQTAHINDFSNVGSVNGGDVAVTVDSIVFLAQKGQLRAYRYDGATFTNIDSVHSVSIVKGVAAADDGTVFLSSSIQLFNPFNGGLESFTFDGTAFTRRATITDLTGQRLTVADSTVFLANWRDGLRAYSYNSTSLINTAHINDGDDARDVAVSDDGTVFLANGTEGLFAYTYSPIISTSVDDIPSELPTQFALLQNYPNPFNPSTIISYTIQTAGSVELKIYNTLGQEIRTLVNAVQTTGTHQVTWDGRDRSGNPVAAGLYFYRLKSGSFVETRKMLLIR